MAGQTARARMPGLDVLRGLAIALVLIRHAVPDLLGNGGIVGVVIFFTLSGYLITGLLVSEFDRTGRVSYGEFFRRRALRLYPPLLLLLAVYTVVELTTDRLHDRWYLGKTLVTALTYTSDLPLLPISPGLGHLWTLAIEEQFYLAWPFLLVFGLRRWRLSRMLVVIITTFWLTTVATVVIFNDDVGHLYKLPTSWAITLVIGAAARLFRDRLKAVLTRPRLLGGLGLVVCLLIAVGPEGKGSAMMYLVGGPVIGVATVLMINAATRWTSMPRLLVPLQILGVISYAV
ncbi:MAG TPA: acyltransferase, partial [Propionibacteriaceae bacterium]